MKDIQKTITTVLAITAVLSLFFFALIFILFDFLKVETPLKNSWETFGSYFGGITTLATAYIASKLFNDWREQHNKNIEKDLIINIINSFSKADVALAKFHEGLVLFKLKLQQLDSLSDDEFNNLDKYLQEVIGYLSGVNLEFSSYEEDIRKYSLLFNTNDLQEAKPHLKEIYKSILTIQRHKIILPRSIDQIDALSLLVKLAIIELDGNINDKILRKLKI